MKNFRQYLEEAKAGREYHLRIKTVYPLDDERMDSIERLLKKYNLLDMDGPHKTIQQNNPLDFWDIDTAEVWVLDVVTGLPVSSYILQQELVTVAKIPEKFIVVRGDNDPLEVESERLRAMDDVTGKADQKGLERQPLLTSDPHYPENERGPDGAKFYGNAYNQSFLKYLAAQAATRRDEEVKPASPLFSFVAETPKAGEDFNAEVADAPKSHPWWMSDKNTDFDTGTAPEGNFDDDCRTYSRGYTNPKTGKQTDLQAASRSVRQPEPKTKGKKK